MVNMGEGRRARERGGEEREREKEREGERKRERERDGEREGESEGERERETEREREKENHWHAHPHTWVLSPSHIAPRTTAGEVKGDITGQWPHLKYDRNGDAAYRGGWSIAIQDTGLTDCSPNKNGQRLWELVG